MTEKTREHGPVDILDDRIRSLEKDVSALRKKPKDLWDKTQILSAFLVPVAIAFAGIVFSRATKEAEIRVAETNAKVAQAQLVHSFTDFLTSPEPEKRKLSIDAVLLALGDDGTHLVQTVQQFDPDAGVRAYASEKLGRVDLFAQLIFHFPEGLAPQEPIFHESAELEIRVNSRTDSMTSLSGWSNRPMLTQPDIVLTTQHQNVDRQIYATVDGTTVTQTNTFDRFQGQLGPFSEPKVWDDAQIEAFFRATTMDRWLREKRTEKEEPFGYDRVTRDEFDSFYSVSQEDRETWAHSDYAVNPLLHATLEIYLDNTKVADIKGIVAYVWEHDEDVRNLHVARFVKN